MSTQLELARRPSWWSRAACTGVGPDVFFSPEPEAEAAAKAICARCEVAGQCRDWALGQRLHEGVFGGLSPRERRRLTSRLAS